MHTDRCIIYTIGREEELWAFLRRHCGDILTTAVMYLNIVKLAKNFSKVSKILSTTPFANFDIITIYNREGVHITIDRHGIAVIMYEGVIIYVSCEIRGHFLIAVDEWKEVDELRFMVNRQN